MRICRICIQAVIQAYLPIERVFAVTILQCCLWCKCRWILSKTYSIGISNYIIFYKRLNNDFNGFTYIDQRCWRIVCDCSPKPNSCSFNNWRHIICRIRIIDESCPCRLVITFFPFIDIGSGSTDRNCPVYFRGYHVRTDWIDLITCNRRTDWVKQKTVQYCFKTWLCITSFTRKSRISWRIREIPLCSTILENLNVGRRRS